MIKVGEIADIAAGYHFREAITSESITSGTPVLQLRDIPDGGELVSLINVARLTSVLRPNITKGGILLQSKASMGGKFRVAYYGVDEAAVASSVLFVISVTSQKILPEFLSFYLNIPETQRYMQASSQAHTVRSLRRSDIEEMPIQLPSIEEQRRILDCYQALLKSEELIRERGSLVRDILYKQSSL